MEIRTWKPGAPLGAQGALAFVDPAIVARLTKRRSFDGDRAPYLDEALAHCTRQLLVRQVRRVELSAPVVFRTREPWPAPHLSEPDAPLPRIEILSKEVGAVRGASSGAQRAFVATRALWRTLLRARLR